jgi:MFS transporter, FSR family, fosmidomycin resistance protein
VIKYRLIFLLSFGHLVTDINQGALPAILPFLISEYNLTYSAGASIVFAANSSSAIVQPLFGYLADRLSRPWLIPLAVLVAGVGLGATGLMDSYATAVILAVVSGIGIAAFHPQGARLVNFAAAGKKGTSMSFFGLGGILGFAIGPILATWALVSMGLKGTAVLIIPVAIASVLLLSHLSSFNKLEKEDRELKSNNQTILKEDRWLAFLLLSFIIVVRSITFYGINTFIPLYWTGYLNETVARGGIALSVIAVSGVFGNIFGGWISDRIGFKKMIIWGNFCIAILLPIMIFTDHPTIALIALIPIGFTMATTYSPTIVMGQEYLPNRVGFSSGVTLGISVAFGGIAAPFIGMIGDSYGIWAALASVAFLPVICFLLSLFLPPPDSGLSVENK